MTDIVKMKRKLTNIFRQYISFICYGSYKKWFLIRVIERYNLGFHKKRDMAILVVCVLARYTFLTLQNVCHHVLRTLCIRPFYKRLYSNREHVSRWIKLSIAKFVIGQKCNKNLF